MLVADANANLAPYQRAGRRFHRPASRIVTARLFKQPRTLMRDVLRAEIAHEGGAIIKTLGDAVMASFTAPAPALRSIMRAQAALAAPPEGARPLTLKAGIHHGPCIAVTLNGRLDYFGSHVNIAARLEPLSTGHDCIISAAVRHDPQVAEMLADPAGDFNAEPLETELKGFDVERFELWRVKLKGETANQ